MDKWIKQTLEAVHQLLNRQQFPSNGHYFSEAARLGLLTWAEAEFLYQWAEEQDLENAKLAELAQSLSSAWGHAAA